MNESSSPMMIETIDDDLEWKRYCHTIFLHFEEKEAAQ
jgi:hypothetical protein